MQYPTIPPGAIVERLDELLAGTVDDLAGEATPFGSGGPFDSSALDAAIDDIRLALAARMSSDTPPDLDEDQFEGAMALRLHEALEQYPVEMLDDPSFWAYLAVGPLWFFVRWREDPEKRKRDVYHEYLDGRVNHACVPLRMFLRVHAVANSRLAEEIPRGTDFWRSHVIRVKTGAKPELAQAVAAQQRDVRMTVGPLREYAKRINRRWSNEVIYVLDDEECRDLAQDERE